MPWPYNDEEELRMAQAMRGGPPPQQLVQPQQAQAGNAGPSPPLGTMPLPGPGGSARMGPALPPPTPGADLVKGIGKAGQILADSKAEGKYGGSHTDKIGKPVSGGDEYAPPQPSAAIPPGTPITPPSGMVDQAPLPNPQLRKFAGYFARGGQVAAQRPVVVGEQGPETFVPQQPGYIVPNPRTQQQQQQPPGYMPPQPETASDAFNWRKQQPLISPALQQRFSQPHSHVITPRDVMGGAHTPEELRAQTERFFGPPGGPEKMPPDFSSVRAYGGPVDEDQPYTVGEQGPETFIPQQNQPGYIAHHSLPAGMTSGKMPPKPPPQPQAPAPATNYGNPASIAGPAVQQGPNYATDTLGGNTDMSATRLPQAAPPRMTITGGGMPGQQGPAPKQVPGEPEYAPSMPRMPGKAEAGQLDPTRGRFKRGLVGAGLGALAGAQGGLPGIIGGAATGGIISAASRTGAGNIAREIIDVPQKERQEEREYQHTERGLKQRQMTAQAATEEARPGLITAETKEHEQATKIAGEEAGPHLAQIQAGIEHETAATAALNRSPAEREQDRKTEEEHFQATLGERKAEAKTGAAESAADRGIRIAHEKAQEAEKVRVQQEGDLNDQAAMHATSTFGPDERRRIQVDMMQAARETNGAAAAKKELDAIPDDNMHDAQRREASARFEKLNAEGANIGNQNYNTEMARWVQMYRNEIKKNNGTVPDLHGKQFKAEQVDAIAKQRGNTWDDQARILRHFGADVLDPGNVPHREPEKPWWVEKQEAENAQRQKDAEERKKAADAARARRAGQSEN